MKRIFLWNQRLTSKMTNSDHERTLQGPFLKGSPKLSSFYCPTNSFLLQTTNIFYICVRSAVRILIYSIFVFGKIFHEYVLIYRQVAEIIGYQHTLWWRGVIKSFHLIYSIFIFGQVSKYEYIQYSYSVMSLKTNIFVIHIWSGCQTWIYSIFVFG